MCTSSGSPERRLFLFLAVFAAVDPVIGAVSSERQSGLNIPKFNVTASGLQFIDIKKGEGPEATFGSKITFHYIGRLAGRQGKPFEDTYNDEPFRIVLGRDKIIPGLQEGLLGMREGGKRRLLIPSSLGYADR